MYDKSIFIALEKWNISVLVKRVNKEWRDVPELDVVCTTSEKASFLDTVIYAFHFPSRCLTLLSLSVFHLGIYEGHSRGSTVSHHPVSFSLSSRSLGWRISPPIYVALELRDLSLEFLLGKIRKHCFLHVS